MKKPDFDYTQILPGKIFQISPEGQDVLNIRFGGDFIVATEFYEWGIQGYLALLHEDPGLVRASGIAFIRAKWEDIEPVGEVYWYRDIKRKEEDGSESN